MKKAIWILMFFSFLLPVPASAAVSHGADKAVRIIHVGKVDGTDTLSYLDFKPTPVLRSDGRNFAGRHLIKLENRGMNALHTTEGNELPDWLGYSFWY